VDQEPSGILVDRWRRGDQQAAADLFGRYANRLVALARSRLAQRLAQRVDAEDVMLSVFRSFFESVRADRYEFQRGGDLWQLLVTFTLRKLNDQVRRNECGKRAVTREQPISSDDGLEILQNHLLAHEPSPLEAVALAEEVEQLMALVQPRERRILELRLQGYTVDEIAADLDCGERTVRYGLKKIKQLLEERQQRRTDP
jgi:RNA polymerase sigma factor (sigma-70 family)